MYEEAVYLEGILKTLGWSKAKFYYKKKELISSGVVFYRNQGRPPRRRLCAFPSKIKNWVSLKSTKGEMI